MIESAYRILRVARDASPETVRKAYVSLMRRYPPEHFPEKCASLRQAYQQLMLDDNFVEEIFHQVGDLDSALEMAGWLWGDREELHPGEDSALSGLTFLLVGEDVKRELDALLKVAASQKIEWKKGI
jgi:curved DNA-binding protein CbpA